MWSTIHVQHLLGHLDLPLLLAPKSPQHFVAMHLGLEAERNFEFLDRNHRVPKESKILGAKKRFNSLERLKHLHL